MFGWMPSFVFVGGRARAGVPLYSEIQCIMGNGHMGPPPGEQIDMT